MKVAILKSSRVISLALLFTLIFALLLLTPGCGGSGGDRATPEQLAEIQKKREKKQAEEKVAYEKKMAAQKKEREKKKREAEKKRAEAEDSRRRQQNRSRVTEHPVQFKDWTDNDFYVAKVEQDRRFPEAIGYLADNNDDPGRAVRLLGELITPGTPLTKEELEKIGVRPTHKFDKQIKVLAQAIIALDTDASIELVEKIISGEITTDAPGVAIPAVLQAIAERPTERNEPIFLDAFRDQYQGGDKLLQTIMAQGASESFRFTLAEYSMATDCPEPQRQAIWDMLCEDDPRNLSATLLLYRDDRLPESYCKILERQFARLAQSAISRVCGFPSEVEGNVSEKQRGSSENRQPKIRRTSGTQSRLVASSTDWVDEAELIKQVKTNLWSDQFATLLAKRLYQVDSLEGDNQLILLAMNTPRNEPRKMLGDLLLRNWQETPSKLSSIGFPEKAVVEPGFWVVAKRVLHESDAAGKGARKKGQRSQSRWSRQEETMDPVQLAWQQAFGKLLITMCGRFEAAGRPVYSQDEITGASTGVADESGGVDDSKKFSMKALLHPNVRPVTECKFQMPTDSLSVHYLRCEELAQPEAVLKHYRGKLDGASELSGPHLCWLGAFVEEEPAEGKLKQFYSADVLLKIEQHALAASNLSDKLEVSIEILLISSN